MKKCLYALVIIVTLVGCSSSRNISAPEKALIGHWKEVPKDASSVEVNYYFSKDEMTMIEKDTKSVFKYKVVSTNNNENWIEIESEGKKGIGTLTRRLQFTSDKRDEISYKFGLSDFNLSSNRADNSKNQDALDVMKGLVNGKDIKIESKWAYIDGNQTQ